MYGKSTKYQNGGVCCSSQSSKKELNGKIGREMFQFSLAVVKTHTLPVERSYKYNLAQPVHMLSWSAKPFKVYACFKIASLAKQGGNCW